MISSVYGPGIANPVPLRKLFAPLFAVAKISAKAETDAEARHIRLFVEQRIGVMPVRKNRPLVGIITRIGHGSF